MPTKQKKSDVPIPSVTSAKKTRLSLSFTQGSRLGMVFTTIYDALAPS